MQTTLSQDELARVCAHFALDGQFLSAAPHGNGHIHDTFAITVEAGRDGGHRPPLPPARRRYILQRINERVFRDVPRLMENIARVSAHVAGRLAHDISRQAPALVRTKDGAAYWRDATQRAWRAFVFVERASSHDIISTPRQAFEAARAFGEFQALLADLPGARLHETIPDFHHTRKRFAALERAIAADVAGRVATVRAEIAFAREHEAMADVLLNLQARGEIPERVTHNDTKLNNVLLDDATGRGVCVIDLDTVMPGLALYDFGDMVRSAANTAAEDETDLSRVALSLPVFEQLLAGYLDTAGGMLNDVEVAHLPFSARLLTFECGTRFLADYLAGDVYFKTRHAQHNLDRCRTQFALVRSMAAQHSAMAALVDQIAT